MSFVDPQTIQNPTTNLFATDGWGDSVNAAFNWIRNPKVGCLLTSVVGTTINVSADTVMPWATESFDVGGCHDNATNNSRITVPTNWGGLWLVGTQFAADSGGGTFENVWIARNGTTKLAGDVTAHSTGATTSVSVETIYVMAAGDYFEVWASCSAASTRSTSITSRFYAWWMASGV